MTTVLETCRLTPPPGAAELTLPLTFFDMFWTHFHPIRRVLFYEHPCSKTEFLQTLVPKLKQSLSLTLNHYLPVAGNFVFPTTTDEKPVLRYATGDSVHLAVAETSRDFDALVGNQARDADQFYDFVPQMPPVVAEPGQKLVPLIAFKITLFPGRGLCLGFSNNHVLGDANSIVGFILAWASINKFNDGDEFYTRNGKSLPIFDRSAMRNTSEIDSIFWNVFGKIPLKESSFPVPTNRVRSTFVLTKDHINKLKDQAIQNKPNLRHVSSFVVSASYIWTCLVKSGDATGEKVGANEPEVFFFAADARGRLNALIDPPVPENYFGNCLSGGVVVLEHGKVAGEDAFVTVAEAISEEIRNRVNNKDEFLKGAENWAEKMGELGEMKRTMGVSGSPKFDLPNADFGWGKARKLEVVSMDGEKYTMSLCKSREFEGGLEVGQSLPKERMEAFAAIFLDGLK